MTTLLAGAGAAAAMLLARGLVEPHLLAVERHVARIPNLPALWEGRRIALLADLHLGLPAGNPGTARRAVRETVAARPAAVLLAGDFVHGRMGSIGDLVEMLRPLGRAGIPAYAVLGNHDHAMPSKDSRGDGSLARELERALTAIGVRVLHNEVVELPAPETGEALYLAGLGAHIPREDRPAWTLAGLPADAPRLVMMHHPSSFNELPPHSAPFAVAAHTHGGQVRLPFRPLVHYLTYIKEVEVLDAGWVRTGRIDGYGEEGNSLYVSRGIGCSVLPLRLFCLPELTLFTLRGGD